MTFLGSYNIFISPICGVCTTPSLSSFQEYPTYLISHIQIIIVDYFFVKRGNIHTPSLFNPAPRSLYYYTKGWNLKAVACWVSAAVFGIPGLIGAYHPTWVGAAAIHIYQTGWVICFAVSVALYFAVNLALPAKVFPTGYESSPKAFELLAESEGYFAGESPIVFGVLSGVDSEMGHQQDSGATSVVSIRDVVGGEKV